MLYRKQGFPEDSEIVFCTVSKVHYNSVFVIMDFYNRPGMIHISEISAGRIRNIRDYVKEDKKIVCKVLRVDASKGHVDLSLRRVSDNLRRKTVDELKQEQKAEKIIEHVAKNLKIPLKKFYEDISKNILDTYSFIHQAFNAIVEDNLSLNKDLGIDKKQADILEKLVRERIKPKRVVIQEIISIESYEPDGVKLIKTVLLGAIKKDCLIKYVGSGKYHLEITDKTYKLAESRVLKINEYIEKSLKKAEVKFERLEQ